MQQKRNSTLTGRENAKTQTLYAPAVNAVPVNASATTKVRRLYCEFLPMRIDFRASLVPCR